LKFTSVDTDLDAAIKPTAIDDETITVSYSGRASGTVLSAIVKDDDGELTHYGQLDTSGDASGETEVTLPTGFNPDTDKLQIFPEKINAGNFTDFCGTPYTVQFAEDRAAPSGLSGVEPETKEDDYGKIAGVDGAVEYRLANSQDAWTSVSASAEEITDLTPNVYEVRYKAGSVDADGKIYLEPSASVNITVPIYSAPLPQPNTPPSPPAPPVPPAPPTPPALQIPPNNPVGNEKITYEVAKHFGTWSGKGSLTAKVLADYAKFESLTLNGKTIKASHYQTWEGSTYIKLKESYLKTLKNGSYDITAKYKDGSANLSLKVAVAKKDITNSNGTKPPATGDTQPIWLLLILAALLTIAHLLIGRRSMKRTVLISTICTHHRN
jgi:hypothetical protein